MNKKLVLSLSLSVVLCFLLCVGLNPVGVKASFGYPENCCLSYDGTDDWVNSSISPVFRVQKLTVELWMKPKYTIETGSNLQYGHQYGLLIAYRDRTYHHGWFLEFDYSDGTLWFVLRDPFTVDRVFKTSRNVWNNTIWYHVAVTYDSELPNDNVNFYVNATLDVSRDSTYTISYLADSELFMGDYPLYVTEFGGLIDEVEIWNGSRSQAQIQDCWNRTLDETECNMPELLGYWRFDEGTGTSVQDYSNQNNNLTLATSPYTPTWVCEEGAPIIPEFPSFLILPLFLTATLLAVIVYRKNNKVHKNLGAMTSIDRSFFHKS